MPRALPLLLLSALVACTTDTNFTRQQDDVEVVEGNGEMLIEPSSVNLYGLVPEITTSETLRIENVGDNNLVLYEARIITSGGGTFYLPEEWLTTERTVAAGQSIDMIIAATLGAEGTQEGSLRIKSNDVNLLERYVTLQATSDPEETETTPGDTGTTPAETGIASDTGA
jgi:hypothetical protein